MKKPTVRPRYDYGHEVPPLSRAVILNCARTIHDLVGYDLDKPFPILKFAEHVLPDLFPDFDWEIGKKDELGESFGVTYPHEHRIIIREDVYEAACDGNPFGRTVVAHECGHFLLHENVPMAMAKRSAANLPAYRSSEWQANAFAGALLMPAERIAVMNVADIASRYLVTSTAAKTQRDAVRKELARMGGR